MIRTANTVEVLKPIAIVAALAIILWSLGLPSLRFAEAANVTSFSDTLSDTAPSVGSNHTIQFTTPTGVSAGGTITVTFDSGFDLTSLLTSDYSLTVNGTPQTLAASPTGSTWGVGVSGQTVTFTSASATVGAGQTVVIDIGTNVSGGAHQIVNPATTGSKAISLTAGASDTGTTRVVILSAVTVSATVNTSFTFKVSGTNAGTTVNGTTTTGKTGSTTIPFGVLQPGVATTTAQQLAVSTNAANGYVVTVQLDGALRSSTGATISGFDNGSDTNTPTAWAAPSATPGSANTYGHWGVTSDDTSVTSRGSNQFGSDQWIAASTSPRAVMGNTGPTNGTGAGVGTTTVGYKVQISALQAAGDYSTRLTYVATPTF